ncbi:site-specific integrase [Streptomyces sp. SYSU K21746]
MNQSDGKKVAWLDRRTGYLKLLVEEQRDAEDRLYALFPPSPSNSSWTAGRYEDDPKTDACARTIALDSDTVQALRRHRAQQDELYEEIGLPPVRLHDLRHGAATLAHAAGPTLKDIQEMLGHSSITFTADT